MLISVPLVCVCTLNMFYRSFPHFAAPLNLYDFCLSLSLGV